MNLELAKKESTELVVQEAEPKQKEKTKEPSMYQVIMHNDDFTPMEFVVAVLELYFGMERTKATQVMYEVHVSGKAICGIYSKDVAETKVEQVIEYARMHEHPLLCSVEVV